MNGLRFLIGLCIVFFGVLIGLASTAEYTEKRSSDHFLKTTNVAEAFYEEGIEINLSQKFSPQDYIVEDKMPAIWDLPGSQENLFIYEFSSIEIKIKALAAIREGSLQKTPGFTQLLETNTYLINTFDAKNILMIYVVHYDPKAVGNIRSMTDLDRMIQLIAPNMKPLREITFARLNQGKTLKYQGMSKSWEGRIEVEYYQYAWTDQDGNAVNESKSNEIFYLKYIGNDSEKVQEVICSYDGPTGFGQGVFDYPSQTLDPNGYIRLGSSNETNAVNPNGGYVFNIQWGQGNEILAFDLIDSGVGVQ